jgi:hypothetical protein
MWHSVTTQTQPLSLTSGVENSDMGKQFWLKIKLVHQSGNSREREPIILQNSRFDKRDRNCYILEGVIDLFFRGEHSKLRVVNSQRGQIAATYLSRTHESTERWYDDCQDVHRVCVCVRIITLDFNVNKPKPKQPAWLLRDFQRRTLLASYPLPLLRPLLCLSPIPLIPLEKLIARHNPYFLRKTERQPRYKYSEWSNSQLQMAPI